MEVKCQNIQIKCFSFAKPIYVFLTEKKFFLQKNLPSKIGQENIDRWWCFFDISGTKYCINCCCCCFLCAYKAFFHSSLACYIQFINVSIIWLCAKNGDSTHTHTHTHKPIHRERDPMMESELLNTDLWCGALHCIAAGYASNLVIMLCATKSVSMHTCTSTLHSIWYYIYIEIERERVSVVRMYFDRECQK